MVDAGLSTEFKPGEFKPGEFKPGEFKPGSSNPAAAPPPENAGGGQQCGNDNSGAIKVCCHRLPLRSEEISKENKDDYPDETTRPGIESESPERQTCHARHERGKVAYSGDEISHRQSPFAEPRKPFFCFWKMGHGMPPPRPKALQHVNRPRPPQEIAERDTTKAPRKCHGDSGSHIEASL